jgi:type III secretory pathway component EscT
MADFFASVLGLAARSGVDLAALGLSWVRAMPAVTIVPAFGLRALPAPGRALLGLALAGCIFPALAPAAVVRPGGAPWALLALAELARGLPVALAAAVPLWVATMVGGVADAVRGAQDTLALPTVEGRSGSAGVLLSMLACAIFLQSGGPAHVAEALSLRAAGTSPLQAAVADLATGMTFAVAVAGPLLSASVIIEVAAALIARAASPAQVHALLAPLRALLSIAALALALDRIAAALANPP